MWENEIKLPVFIIYISNSHFPQMTFLRSHASDIWVQWSVWTAAGQVGLLPGHRLLGAGRAGGGHRVLGASLQLPLQHRGLYLRELWALQPDSPHWGLLPHERDFEWSPRQLHRAGRLGLRWDLGPVLHRASVPHTAHVPTYNAEISNFLHQIQCFRWVRDDFKIKKRHIQWHCH